MKIIFLWWRWAQNAFGKFGGISDHPTKIIIRCNQYLLWDLCDSSCEPLILWLDFCRWTITLVFYYDPSILIGFLDARCKDTNRKIRKTEFIFICRSKNGSSSSAVNTGDIWSDVSHVQKAMCMSCYEFWTKIQTQESMKNFVPIFLLVSLARCRSPHNAMNPLVSILKFSYTVW